MSIIPYQPIGIESAYGCWVAIAITMARQIFHKGTGPFKTGHWSVKSQWSVTYIAIWCWFEALIWQQSKPCTAPAERETSGYCAPESAVVDLLAFCLILITSISGTRTGYTHYLILAIALNPLIITLKSIFSNRSNTYVVWLRTQHPSKQRRARLQLSSSTKWIMLLLFPRCLPTFVLSSTIWVCYKDTNLDTIKQKGKAQT